MLRGVWGGRSLRWAESRSEELEGMAGGCQKQQWSGDCEFPSRWGARGGSGVQARCDQSEIMNSSRYLQISLIIDGSLERSTMIIS